MGNWKKKGMPCSHCTRSNGLPLHNTLFSKWIRVCYLKVSFKMKFLTFFPKQEDPEARLPRIVQSLFHSPGGACQ